jgi:hypothetical protein
MLPVSAGVENAMGGTGKSTRHLWEAKSIILGRPLYGHPIERSGPVLVVTREDDATVVRWRVHRIGRDMELSPAEQRQVANNLHVLDLVGKPERLIKVDRAGNLVRTDLAERICKSYAGEGVVLVEFDPLIAFGPGERFVNDGEAAVLDVGHAIARELGAAVRFTSHVSKVVGREGIVDAHSGRGGSALGDNSRFVWNFVRHEPGHNGYQPPASARDVMPGDLYRLHLSKLTAARPDPALVWIERRGFQFITHEGGPETIADRLRENCEKLRTFLEVELARGAKYTRNDLEHASDRHGIGRKQLRDAVRELLAGGEVIESVFPESERQGGRKTYLAPRVRELAVTGGGDEL